MKERFHFSYTMFNSGETERLRFPSLIGFGSGGYKQYQRFNLWECGGIGRRNGLKIRWEQSREGSSPSSPTILKRKRVFYMEKRPYYIITHFVEYDGYSDYFDYVGVNAKAALERFKYLYDDLRRQYFTDEHVQVVGEYFPNDLKVEHLVPGQVFGANLNDDNECWISIRLSVVHTGEFQRTDGGWEDRAREVRYRTQNPKAKY